MTVNDASLGESGSKLSKVAATSLLMGVTRASSEAYIKPKSYTWDAPYIAKARTANKAKNAAYTKLKGVPVFDIISKTNGEIQSPQVLEQIRNLI